MRNAYTVSRIPYIAEYNDTLMWIILRDTEYGIHDTIHP